MAATAYITTDNLIDSMGVKIYEILGVADGDDISTNDKVLAAIEVANARVDAAIRANYDPADVMTDASLKEAAIAIARYSLVEKTRADLMAADVVFESAFDKAVSYLRDVQKGSSKGGVDLTYQPENRSEVLIGANRTVLGSSVIATATSPASQQSWFRNIF